VIIDDVLLEGEAMG